MGGPTYISGGTSACSRPFTVHRCWPAELNSLCVLRSYPLRGMKFTDYEGGTRVASWVSGGVIPATQRGTTHSAGLVHIADCACPRVSNRSQRCVDPLVCGCRVRDLLPLGRPGSDGHEGSAASRHSSHRQHRKSLIVTSSEVFGQAERCLCCRRTTGTRFPPARRQAGRRSCSPLP